MSYHSIEPSSGIVVWSYKIGLQHNDMMHADSYVGNQLAALYPHHVSVKDRRGSIEWLIQRYGIDHEVKKIMDWRNRVFTWKLSPAAPYAVYGGCWFKDQGEAALFRIFWG